MDLETNPLQALACLAQDIRDDEMKALGTGPGPGQPGLNSGATRRLEQQIRVNELANKAFVYGATAGIDYASLRGVVGNVASACTELMNYGQRTRKPPEDWELEGESLKEPGKQIYSVAGEAARLIQQIGEAANELLVLDLAASARLKASPPAAGTGQGEGDAGKDKQPAKQEDRPLSPDERKEALAQLELHFQKAYLAFEDAQRKQGKKLTVKDAYKWIKDNGITDYELPKFRSFSSYVSIARKALRLSPYSRRAGRSHGKSVADADQL